VLAAPFLGAVSLVGALIPLGAASAQEEAEDGRPEMMREPTSYVDVVDAFDDEDLFDLNITAGYLRTWELGRIERQGMDASGDGRNSQHWDGVANYERGINQLMLGLDVGIFRDLAVYARLPLILSDDRSLTAVDGFNPATIDTPTDGPLFDLSGGFNSPTRSGVDYLAVGVAWSILNQNRDRFLPTWMVMIEGRFNLGDPMRACGGAGGPLNCNYRAAPPAESVTPEASRQSAGVGRGMNALRIETRSSWRYEVVEPYAGLAFQIEWPGYSNSNFIPQGDLQGYINELPPIMGRFTLGMAIIPFEDREHFQRFTIDVRLNGEYLSEGHDYSPLFDALGSSANAHLSTLSRSCAGPDCAPGGTIPFYGLTDTQSRGRFGGQLTLEMVAARYIRFSVLAGFMYSPAYVITQADACNPNVTPVDPPGGEDPRRGTCASGIINPHHRPVLDLPGVRFRMAEQWQVDLGINVTATF
jgi:hypothetical protein